MTWMRAGFRKAFRLDRRDAQDATRDVDEEMRLHVELRAAQLEREGRDPEEALHEAQQLFARDHDTVHELYATAYDRDQHIRWRERWESWWHDARYAARSLLRDRLLTGFIVVALALGIGANVTAFSLVDRLLLRAPAHVRNAEQLLRVHMSVVMRPAGLRTTAWIPYRRYLGMRDGMRTVSALEMYRVLDDMVGRGRDGRKRRVGTVSGGLFPLLGVQAERGRMFTSDENASTQGHLAVLSDRYWRNEFGADDTAIGQTIVIGDVPHLIVGIAPPDFSGIERSRVDVWSLADRRTASSVNWWIVGRLKPGMTLAAASREAEAAHRATADAGPKWTRGATFSASPISFGDSAEEPVEAVTARWMAVVSAVILLIACANIVNLLMARLARRRRELAIRVALGAGRARVVRLLGLEGMLLALIAAVASLVVVSITEPFVRLAIFPDAGWTFTFADWRVLAAVVGVTLCTGLLVGVIPALQAGSTQLTAALRSGERGSGHRSRLRSTLTVVQAALSMLLLIGAGLFLKSIARVAAVHLGVDIDRVVTAEAHFPTPTGSFAEQEAMDRSRNRQLLDAVRRVPGVERASLVTGVPFLQGFSVTLSVPGLDSLPGLPGGAFLSAVGDGYFETIGTRLIRGRTFTPQDREGSEPVVIVAETMARTLWPAADALGNCLRIGGAEQPCSRVVGIVEDVHHSGLHEQASLQYYVPTGQEHGFYGANLLIRSRGKANASWPALQQAILAADPTISSVELRLLSEALKTEIRPLRLGIFIFGFSGALALVVAALGLYSVMTYLVAWRTHEIGVRLALGATNAQITHLVMRGGAMLAIAGIAAGLLVAVATRQWLQPRLFETSATDPFVFVTVAGSLLVVALLAGWFPSRRALRISPTEALRSE